jgi:glycosyltransferase involved in cell wall biosynthesis
VTPPLVSVCIPAYNSAPHIGETVASVLAQTLTDLELVVVDDGSTDGTVEVVRGFDDPRLRLEVNPSNLGPNGNWNRALASTTGRYVKLVCGDDVLDADCLERQVAQLESHPEAMMAAGRRRIVGEDGEVILAARGLGGGIGTGLVSGADAMRAAVRSGSNPFGEPVCVLLRREAVDRVGGFSPDAAYMIDLDYWCRVAAVGPVFTDPGVVGSFRVVATSWSNSIGRGQAEEAAALFRRLRVSHPDVIRPADLTVGLVRARVMNVLRVALYSVLAARRRRRRRRP